MRRLDALAALVALVAVGFLACSPSPMEDAVPQSGEPSSANDSAGSVVAPPSAPTTVEAPTTTTTTSTTEPERVTPATDAPATTVELPEPPPSVKARASYAVPAWAQGVPGAESVPPILWRIARCEGAIHPGLHDPWTEWNHQGSGASGPWQDMAATWGGYGGYANAADAPPSVQVEFNVALYERRGTQPWLASESCWRNP